MECGIELGKVVEVADFALRQELIVTIDNQREKAINFPALTGKARVGDEVVLNTTAVRLNLGSGGSHFVMAIIGQQQSLQGQGHIMKLRYTPNQGRVLSVEEQESNDHQTMVEANSLDKMPVIVGSLHSMLAPVCLALNRELPGKRWVYLMSDGAALPIGLSRLVESLQSHNLLGETITFGHAFGGDIEAVHIFSALLAAKSVCRADVAIVLMGPGVVGTGTPFGTTALEQGIYLNAVDSLGGIPIALPRVSLADLRERHQGISHHTLTSLQRVAKTTCYVGLPTMLQDNARIKQQVSLLNAHKVFWRDSQLYEALLQDSPVELRSMGRGLTEDPAFFHTAFVAGLGAAEVVRRGTIHLA